MRSERGDHSLTRQLRRSLCARVACPTATTLALILLIGGLAPSRSARAAFPGDNGKLAFAKAGDIWSADADGSNAAQLTTNPAGDRSPRWSPDGRKIAFASNRDGDFEIFVMNADGSDERQLTFNTGAQDRFPAWTADGARIVYDRDFSEIYVITVDGSGGELKLADGFVPGTSPHGDKVVFTGGSTLFEMRADGSGLREILSGAEVAGFNASWSPRRNDLVFAGDFATEPDNDVFRVRANGSSLEQLTDTDERLEFSPVWSPDGSKIAFVGCVGAAAAPDCSIYAMNADGSGEVELVSAVGAGTGAVDWQPIPGHRVGPTAGELDPAFGAGGKVVTDFGGSSFDRADAAALLPNGQIVALGSSNAAGAGFDFALARYEANGSLDSQFGSGGTLLTDLGSRLDVGTAIAVAPDGKIIAAGFNRPLSGGFDFAVVRHNRDGSLDTSFGSGGKTLTDLGGGSGDSIATVALDHEGRIIAAGTRTVVVRIGDMWVATSDFAIVRYNQDGSLDETFGSGGIVLTDLGSDADTVAKILLQPDGKIIAAGLSSVSGSDDFALVRYLPDGSLDPSFGSGGVMLTDIGSFSDDLPRTAAVEPGGKIVVAGGSDAAGASFDLAVVRYNGDGSVDSTFGAGGAVLTDLGNGSFDFVTALVGAADGKLVAAGFTDSAADFAVVRYNGDGSVDRSFGVAGIAFSDFDGGSNDFATAVAVAPSGDVVAAGFTDAAGSLDFALARYTGR